MNSFESSIADFVKISVNRIGSAASAVVII